MLMSRLIARAASGPSLRRVDRLTIVVLFLLCVALTLWGWAAVRTTLESNVAARFAFRTAAATDKLATALSAYREVVHHGAMATTAQTDENAWSEYVRQMHLAQRLPGLATFGACARDGDRIARRVAYSVRDEVALGPENTLAVAHAASATGAAYPLQAGTPGHKFLVLVSDTGPASGCAYAIVDIDTLVHVAIGPLVHDLTLLVAMTDASGHLRPVFDSMSPRAPGEPRPAVAYRAQTIVRYGTRPALFLTYSASGEFARLRGTGVAMLVLMLGVAMSGLTALAWALALRERRGARSLSARVAEDKRCCESRLYSVIQSVREAIITIDDDHRIQIFNPTAENIFQCSAMDAIGTPLDRFIPARFREVHRAHIERFGLTGVTERRMGSGGQLAGLRADGAEFPMEASISQMVDASGKFYTVILRDVTEHRRIATALQTSRNELEKLSGRLQEVREAEKRRIARELHDDLGQRLTALKMDASLLRRSVDGHSPAGEGVAQIERAIDGIVVAVRQMAADLRPPMLDDLGLGPAIEWYIQDFSRRYGVAVDLTGAPTLPPVPPAVATGLFRIVQEALNNVAKHARATSVTIDLCCDTAYRLSISDNGRGLPERPPKPNSLGLVSMRERARLLGGTLEVHSPAEGGTVVTAVIPRRLPPPAPPILEGLTSAGR
ncbi:Oxygen sensor histidine kinase NreB [Pandoraea sputorum]|nr:Oxygen sensor histidine kinase NreB [Pandoraea sputorum]